MINASVEVESSSEFILIYREIQSLVYRSLTAIDKMLIFKYIDIPVPMSSAISRSLMLERLVVTHTQTILRENHMVDNCVTPAISPKTAGKTFYQWV